MIRVEDRDEWRRDPAVSVPTHKLRPMSDLKPLIPEFAAAAAAKREAAEAQRAAAWLTMLAAIHAPAKGATSNV